MMNDRQSIPSAPPHPSRTSVLERAHRVLSAFEQSRRYLSISEISRSTGLPMTTAHRIIMELLALGLLERDDRDRLSIGIDLWKIGLCAPKASGLQRVTLPFMQDMFAATGFPIHLAVLKGFEVLFVENLHNDQTPEKKPQIGAEYPPHVTAVGKALLASKSDAFLREYLDHWQERLPRTGFATTVPVESVLRQDLAKVRTEGISVSDRQADPDAVALGAAIRTDDAEPRGALSIIVPLGVNYAPYALLLRTTVMSIQRLLQSPQ